MNKQLTLRRILLSLVGFVILWAIVTDAWGYSDRCFQFNGGNYVYSYLSRLVWVLPAVYLVIRYSDSLRVNKKALFSLPHFIFSLPHFNKSLIVVFIVSAVYVICVMLVNHKGFWLNKNINLLFEIMKYVIVGFVEEAVFRGWGYNALTKVTTDKKAVILSTMFFVFVHWPAYFVKLYRFGIFDISGLFVQSLSAVVWGPILCWLLKSGKTIWNPIIAHTFYDLASVLLIS